MRCVLLLTHPLSDFSHTHSLTRQEDNLLAGLLKKHRHDQPNWRQIAEELNRKSAASSRTGKQCRERWRNQLRPKLKKGAWTIAEEQMIRNMYQMFGPK